MITASESSLSSVVSDVPVSEEVVVVETTPTIVSEEVVSTTETAVATKPTKAKKTSKKKSTKAKKAAKKSTKKEKKATVVEATEPVVVETTEPVVTTEVVSEPKVETVKAGPGRPLRYTGNVEKSIVALYNEVGTVLQTRNVLIAPNDSELSNKRDKTVIPEPLTISMPCLTVLLKRNGITGRGPGRPKVEVVETVNTVSETVEADTVEATVSVEVSETIDVISTESQPVEVSTENVEVSTEPTENPTTNTAAA